MRAGVLALGGLLTGLAVSVLAIAAVHDTAQDSVSSPPTTTSPSGSLIQMMRIAVIHTPARRFLSAPQGLDFDDDGQREFIIRKEGQNGLFEFYESIADNTCRRGC